MLDLETTKKAATIIVNSMVEMVPSMKSISVGLAKITALNMRGFFHLPPTPHGLKWT